MKGEFLLFLVGCFIATLIGVGMWAIIFLDNVRNSENEVHEFFIPTGSDYETVRTALLKAEILKNIRSFDWVANKMNYAQHIEPGYYTIANNLSNKALITGLRNGYAEREVKLSLHSIDTKAEIAAVVSNVLEVDSLSIITILENDSFANTLGYSVDAFWGTVLADTYLFHWDTDAMQFMKRMSREYAAFWSNNRVTRADKIGLDPMECIILASIIEKESAKPVEYKTIAGVYLNRLNQRWPLQADPTVKFALNQPGLKRILNVHLTVDSPYNTYKYPGLPPGPIGLPEKTTIDAVLDAESHDYMYFCANSDFSGYHVFARTLQDHNRNARKYQAALNEKGIR